MAVTDAPQIDAAQQPAPARRARRRLPFSPDLLIGLSYAFFAWFLTIRLWINLDDRMVVKAGDQMFFMWVLRHGARILTKGVHPFFTDQLNVPDGVNLMANTSSLALTLPMAPVTLLFGPRVSFALLLVIGLAGTAFAWYKVFQRIVGSRPAAVVGGAFCGFAPGMISHANGHVNWTAQFLVPLIVLALLRLAEPGRVLRGGVRLGLLITAQAFINEEVLLYTALASAVFVVAYAIFAYRDRPAEIRQSARRMLPALALAAGVAGVLLAYPLSQQFFGPGSYQGVPGDASAIRADLASYWSFSRLSLAGSDGENPLALNITEENTFLGWPLLVLSAVGVVVLWQRLLVKAIAATAGVFFVFSLGPTLLAAERNLGVPLPWILFRRIPPLDSVLTTRFGMVLIPLFGALIALMLDKVRSLEATNAAGIPVRRLGYLAVACALLPIVPTPVPAHPQPVTPQFFTSGAWREYVPQGYALVPVPDTSPGDPLAMVWLAESNADFKIPGGYFIGPGANGRGIYGADPVRPTTELLLSVAQSGRAPTVTAQMRQQLSDDIATWHASVLVLPDDAKHAQELRRLLDELVGRPGEHVSDVTVWRVV